MSNAMNTSKQDLQRMRPSDGETGKGCDAHRMRTVPIFSPRFLALCLLVPLSHCLIVPASAAPNAFLEQHCYDCHDSDTKKGGLDLTSLGTDYQKADLMAKWVRIHDRVNAGEMPPKKKTQPETKEKQAFLGTLAKSLTDADVATKGVLVRRLTRVEYENTVRDLLGVRTELQALLPEDGKAHGFDKVSEGLDLSSAHLQRYMDAAALALRDAIQKGPRPESVRQTVALSMGLAPNAKIDPEKYKLPDGSLVLIGDGGYPTYFPPFTATASGRYRFKLTGRAYQSQENIVFKIAAGRGFGGRDKLRDIGMYEMPAAGGVVEFETWLFAGEKIQVRPPFRSDFGLNRGRGLEGYEGKGLALQPIECEGPLLDEWPSRGHKLMFGNLEAKPGGYRMMNQGGQFNKGGQFNQGGKFQQGAGRKDNQTGKAGERDVSPSQSPTVPSSPPQGQGQFKGKGQFQGQGGQFQGKGKFQQGQNNFVISPANPKEEAQRLISAFLPVAFRRPVAAETTALYVKLAHDELDLGTPFEDAMLTAYTAALAAPEFLYLREPEGKLDDYALAARLSYFLWSSAPDAELISLASKGELSKADVLRAQTERLLADPKAERFTQNFTGQWLSLREIEATTPDKQLYPEFDDALQAAMLGETHGFFTEVLKNNLNLSQFIDSDWAMLNSRLAKHYGIDGVSGLEFRKVALKPEHHRGGVLAQASVLKVTANGVNTSPIKRGAFVLDRILGSPPPPPPPGVPGVEPDTRGATTLRQQLDKHRNLESCNSCHRSIDPPGFALENYDVIGGWRETYRILANASATPPQNQFGKRNQSIQWKPGLPVDATGVTPDGATFNDLAQYKKLLAGNPERFTRALAEQLSVYATGRGMGFSDRPELDRITSAVTKKGNGFRDLVHEIVQSDLFKTK